METSRLGHYNDTSEASGDVYADTLCVLVRLVVGGILVACMLYQCAKYTTMHAVAPRVLLGSATLPSPPAYEKGDP